MLVYSLQVINIIISELRKEGLSQDKIDHVFKAIVLPKIVNGPCLWRMLGEFKSGTMLPE